jgi:hypothetical protein
VKISVVVVDVVVDSGVFMVVVVEIDFVTSLDMPFSVKVPVNPAALTTSCQALFVREFVPETVIVEVPNVTEALCTRPLTVPSELKIKIFTPVFASFSVIDKRPFPLLKFQLPFITSNCEIGKRVVVSGSTVVVSCEKHNFKINSKIMIRNNLLLK